MCKNKSAYLYVEGKIKSEEVQIKERLQGNQIIKQEEELYEVD